MVSTRRATDRKENLSVWLVPGEPQTERKSVSMVSTRRATDRKENLSVWLVPGEPQTEKKICQYG